MRLERALLVSLLLSVACHAPTNRRKPVDASLASHRLAALALSDNGIAITLDNAFIQANAMRVTIATQLNVDQSRSRAFSPITRSVF